ncbi:uncharacterized protein LOC117167551 isoform X2 [Belonocnema kinseyi]|uniref:uncharacterized protein LOC117167551 isoform X2 n=1 Tax=Belonocnema kinseyi TaxID=2817044 RepID=UPI00143D5AB7|nr:uncharacterized protein LOC117167551 isoform X2 [Belonocnema kinseyi]
MRIIKISGLSALLLFVACAPGYTSGQYDYHQSGFGEEISSHSHNGNGGDSASYSQSDVLNGYVNLQAEAVGQNADAYAKGYPNNGYNVQPASRFLSPEKLSVLRMS